MKISRLRSTIVVAASMVSLALTSLSPVSAAPTSQATQPVGSGNGMKISPLRTDITLAPGVTGKVDVQITNVTKTTAILQPIENDFVASGENGEPALVLDSNSYAPTHSLKRFMIPLSAITVAPGQTQTVTVNITVPKSAQAGGYFGALRFAPTSLGSPVGSGAALGESVASLILLTVPGPTVEQLTMTNFDVQQNGGTASNFRTPTDLSLLLRFQNKGNLQEAPFGQIYVQKGKKVLYAYSFNQDQPQDEVLPDSARRWTVPLKNLGKFGKYTVGATFSYGTKGQSIDITKTVWIIPTVYILTIVGIVVFLAVVIVGGWTFLKSYKRKILRSSRRRY
ncbi:MAG TPA: hypothetical protein VLE99_06035 [Candidatus Saccharimonadales bacterium]|nr:hypothetical protein [Candidatus Saccharimonadales bacterium]